MKYLNPNLSLLSKIEIVLGTQGPNLRTGLEDILTYQMPEIPNTTECTTRYFKVFQKLQNFHNWFIRQKAPRRTNVFTQKAQKWS